MARKCENCGAVTLSSQEKQVLASLPGTATEVSLNTGINLNVVHAVIVRLINAGAIKIEGYAGERNTAAIHIKSENAIIL